MIIYILARLILLESQKLLLWLNGYGLVFCFFILCYFILNLDALSYDIYCLILIEDDIACLLAEH